MNTRLLNALKLKSMAKKEKALMELELLLTKSAAIGEHTTNHLLEEATNALKDLADAESELEMIGLYLDQDSPNNLLLG